MSKTILIINGPNLNLLGKRKPEVYGTTTLDELVMAIKKHAETISPKPKLHFVQFNHEGSIVDVIHQAKYPSLMSCQKCGGKCATETKSSTCSDLETQWQGNVDGIIINAGAYTHTSVAIGDALEGVQIPYVEVHITDVYKREKFRHFSYLRANAKEVIAGEGINGYLRALDIFCK